MLGRCIRRSTITASCSLIHRKIETPGVTFCLSDPPICFHTLHCILLPCRPSFYFHKQVYIFSILNILSDRPSYLFSCPTYCIYIGSLQAILSSKQISTQHFWSNQSVCPTLLNVFIPYICILALYRQLTIYRLPLSILVKPFCLSDPHICFHALHCIYIGSL